MRFLSGALSQHFAKSHVTKDKKSVEMSQTSFIKSNTLLRTTHSLTLRSGGYARRNIKQKDAPSTVR